MPKEITLRVLDGPSRGKEFTTPLPLTIGREPGKQGNVILLNDERVSRYHLKLVEQNDKIFLADTGSTNGTRLNGEIVTAAEVHVGDIIAVGRSTIIVGSRDEIRRRLDDLSETGRADSVVRSILDDGEWDDLPSEILREIESVESGQENPLLKLHRLTPPPMPQDLNIEQFSHLADLLLYIQIRLRLLVHSGLEQPTDDQIVFTRDSWQNLLDLHAIVAKYLHEMSE